MSKHSGKKYRSSQNPAASSCWGELRIIGGKWRRRKITFPAVQGLRPTPSRIRETLFNWLTPDLPGCHCLDLFAGSGALGFEALSRGAKSVTMIDNNQQVVRQLDKNKGMLDANNLQILNQDATAIQLIENLCLKSPDLQNSYDIIFCDPPFNQDLIQPLFDSIDNSGLLKNATKLYIETEKSLACLALPENWMLLKEKTAGDVRYRLCEVGKR